MGGSGNEGRKKCPDSWMVVKKTQIEKNIYIYLPIVRAKFVPESKMLKNLLEFILINISVMLILILKSKINFIKYLPPARLKLFPKMKYLEFIEILYIWYFKYTNFDFNVKNVFYEIFTSCQAKLPLRLKMLLNSCLIFQVSWSRLRDLIKVSLSIYYMLCQNWSPSVNSNLDYKM